VKSPSIIAGLWLVAAGVILQACQEETVPVGPDLSGETLATQAHKKLDLSICDPEAGGFTTVSTNLYFPMEVGDQWAYEGEEDGVPVSLLITVLGETRVIDEVTTRVIEEREWEDGELLEVSWNYFAQAGDGTICYFGEDVDIYEEEGISHEGAWCAEDPDNPDFAPGIFMPADPEPGMKYPMEFAPGVAQDEGQIVGNGPFDVLGTTYETIRVRESSPLDVGFGYKIFGAGFGLIVDGPLEVVSFVQGAPTPGPPTITEQVCGS
jgi:hypothetical protein